MRFVKLCLAVGMTALLAFPASAQVTTAVLRGEVTDRSGGPVAGATVLALHEPSGTRYHAVTNREGQYAMQGMRPGGPYRVEVSFVGMETCRVDDIRLHLGEAQRCDAVIGESQTLLEEVVVTARVGANAAKTGAAMRIGGEQIARMPSITHGIADAIRLNPQVSISPSGAISFAGTNNRYNSFRIDGVMNNDVYGLAENGSNGGQAGTQPVSLETLQEIQLNIAPFDVRQSGFTGGSINAVTKSGTNELHGSVYGFGNDQTLIGSRYRRPDGSVSSRYPDQYEYRAGATLGGALVRNRFFFFAYYERADRTNVNPYALGASSSLVDAEQALGVLDAVKRMAAEQGISYGGHLDASEVSTRSDKAGLRLDWNMGGDHKLSLRWSLVSARQTNNASEAATLNASDYSYDFVSTTHSLVAELQSPLSERLNNELRAAYQRVRDRREPGAPFPMIQIRNVGDGVVNLGNDRSSMANRLDQDIWSLTDNLSWQLGRHTLVAGTHNEFYRFSNLFIQDAYGCYIYGSADDFHAGRIMHYRYAQANVEVTGDPRWANTFGAGMLGFYVQDDLNVSNELLLTMGLRMDIPLFFDRPAENAPFNAFMTSKGLAYRTDAGLRSRPLLSPRFGFRWMADRERYLVLRGGVGVFTGRVPFVWLANNYANTGVQMSTYIATDQEELAQLELILDPKRQAEQAGRLAPDGSQLINIYDRKFRLPQSLRADLALDLTLGGVAWTAEAVYSKTLNDATYRNLAVEPSGKTLAESSPGLDFDRRPMMRRVEGADTYTGIYLMENTSRGYTWNLSLTGKRHFGFGLDAMLSYTFVRSMAVNSGNRTVAQSGWQNNCVSGDPNAPPLTRSAFNIPHTVRAALFYTRRWNTHHATTLGAVYTGSSGAPYSICYNGDLNGDGGFNDLIYIPTDEQVDRMDFVASNAYSAEAQRENFRGWLASHPYLKEHRGRYFEKNAANESFEHHVDLHVSHRFDFRIGGSMRGLEFSVDLINAGNLLSRSWGRTSVPGIIYNPVTYMGDGRFQFLHEADSELHANDDYLSRWRAQIGVRFVF